MDIADVPHGALSRFAVWERAGVTSRRRGRHRRPRSRSRVGRWLADVHRRATFLGATWPPIACGTAICGCAGLVLAGLFSVRSGGRRGRRAGNR